MRKSAISAKSNVRASLQVLIKDPRRHHKEAREIAPRRFLDRIKWLNIFSAHLAHCSSILADLSRLRLGETARGLDRRRSLHHAAHHDDATLLACAGNYATVGFSTERRAHPRRGAALWIARTKGRRHADFRQRPPAATDRAVHDRCFEIDDYALGVTTMRGMAARHLSADITAHATKA